MSQSPIKIELDKSSSISEAGDVIYIISKGKSFGPSKVYPEIGKRGSSKLVEALYDILAETWTKSDVSRAWKDG